MDIIKSFKSMNLEGLINKSNSARWEMDVVDYKGYKQTILVHEILKSTLMEAHWFIYGIINESISGNQDDIVLLVYRVDQEGKGTFTQLTASSIPILECISCGIDYIMRLHATGKFPGIKKVVTL
jgi:hypothetical protein